MIDLAAQTAWLVRMPLLDPAGSTRTFAILEATGIEGDRKVVVGLDRTNGVVRNVFARVDGAPGRVVGQHDLGKYHFPQFTVDKRFGNPDVWLLMSYALHEAATTGEKDFAMSAYGTADFFLHGDFTDAAIFGSHLVEVMREHGNNTVADRLLKGWEEFEELVELTAEAMVFLRQNVPMILPGILPRE